MDLSKFTRQELILAGVAILLAFDLLFLPWFLALLADLAVAKSGHVAVAALGGTARPRRFQEGRHAQHRVFTNA